jgi:hypothetical protein
MSFSTLDVTVDGSLSNPFVAVSLGILIALSIILAYSVGKAIRLRRWGTLTIALPTLTVVVLWPDFLLHVVTALVYNVYYFEMMGVSMLGDHPAWIVRAVSPLGLVLALLRPRRVAQEAT